EQVGLTQAAGGAEVHDLGGRTRPADHDVSRLDVEQEDAAAVDLGQTGEHLPGDRGRLVRRQGAAAVEDPAQGLALHPLHRHEGPTVVAAVTEHADYVGVVDIAAELRFTFEAGHQFRVGGVLPVEDLHRDAPLAPLGGEPY